MLEDGNIPPLGPMAFDSRLNPAWLLELATTAPEEFTETAEILYGFAGDMATIVGLPEVQRGE